MNKICTSIEQSKKLIELGIDINTADMFYADIIINNEHKYNLYPLESFGCKTFKDIKRTENTKLKFIPAWSLSALLELIPERIPGTKFVIKWDGSYYIEGRDCLFDNAIDAAFEMVCYLLENKKL